MKLWGAILLMLGISKGIQITHTESNIPQYIHFRTYEAKQICDLLASRGIKVIGDCTAAKNFNLILYKSINSIILLFPICSSLKYLITYIGSISNLKLSLLVIAVVLLTILGNLVAFSAKTAHFKYYFLGEIFLFFATYYVICN